MGIIISILLITWIAGLVLHIAGGFIHMLLVLAVIIFIMRFFKDSA